MIKRNFCLILVALTLSGCASQKVKIQLGNNGIAPTLSLTFDPVETRVAKGEEDIKK